MTFAFVAIYLGFQLLIGFLVSKKIKTEDDFFLAGRNLPASFLAFSLFATWFGAETCIGTSGAVFKEGLSGSRADPFGYSLCLFILGFLLARKLWSGGFTTIADFYRQRFGNGVEKLAIFILVPSTLLWGAAQLRAFSQIISTMTAWDVEVTLGIAFLFVTVYTLLGGLMGDIITDLIQGVMIALGLLLILFAVGSSDFSWGSWWDSLSPEKLSFQSKGETLWQRLDRWSIPIFGSLIAQSLIARVLAAKSPGDAVKASHMSGGIYLLFGSIPVLLGLIGPAVIGPLPHHEDFLITIAEKFLHPFAFVIFSGALISAILATIDSILLSVSALMSHNVIVPVLKIKKESTKVFTARLFVVLSALVAVLIAFVSESVYALVETASAFGTAGILVITLCGLHFKWGGALAASLSLIVGLITTPIAEYVLELEAPFIASILAALMVYILASLKSPLPQASNA